MPYSFAFRSLFGLAIIVGFAMTSVSFGAVTKVGDVGDYDGYIDVGYINDGSMTVDSGSVVNVSNGLPVHQPIIGSNFGATGTLTVTGSGSSYTSTYMYLGYVGTGYLNISDGGSVTVSKSLGVGNNGRITLTGGTLNAGYFYADERQIFGCGTINANRLVRNDLDLVFDSTASLRQTIVLNKQPGQNVIYNLNLEDGISIDEWYYPGIKLDSEVVAPIGVLFAGNVGTGSVTIKNGVQLTNHMDAIIGKFAGSAGVITVSGSGSQLFLGDSLFVGKAGNGTLNVSDRGKVHQFTAYVGYENAASGTINVNGYSSLTTSGTFAVGYSGTGRLNISGGGSVAVSAFTPYVGASYLGFNAGSYGEATVSGTGSLWTNDFSLHVGQSGAGSLNVTNGGAVSVTGSSFIAYNAGSTGSASVSGGSWETKGALFVGRSGTGELNISKNGYISVSGSTVLGYNVGSVGAVTVKGTNSRLIASATMVVGNAGRGTLSVADGGVVSASGSFIVGYASSSYGEVTVSGSNAQFNTQNGLAIGYLGTGSVSIRSSNIANNLYGVCYLGLKTGSFGELTVSGSGVTAYTSLLNIGCAGRGQMTISNGGALRSSVCFVGQNGGEGLVSVLGTGFWNNTGTLYVGNLGEGSVVVSNGGTAFISGEAHIGSASPGSISVSGSRSKFACGTIYLGEGNQGTLEVTNGGTAFLNATTYVGYSSEGSVSVSGSKSFVTLASSSTCYVGYGGRGIVTVENGGTLNAMYGFYVGNPSSDIDSSMLGSRVDVKGAGSKLVVGNAYVGSSSYGVVNVTAGGSVSAANVSLGYSSTGGKGELTVSGSGSTLSASIIYLGQYGTGTLLVENGGRVSVNSASIGYASGVIGSTATVSGSQSMLECSGSLNVFQNSKLTQTGGTVSTNGFTANSASSTSSFVAYEMTGGTLVASYISKSGTIAFNIGGGTLMAKSGSSLSITAPLTLTGTGGNTVFDSNNAAITVSGGLSGEGGLTKVGAGTLTLSYQNTFKGDANVQEGRLVLTSNEVNLASLDVTTSSGATLAISGGTHRLASITGSGTTSVAGTATLIVGTLVQDTLILGGSGAADDAAFASESGVSQTTATVPEPATWLILVTAAGIAVSRIGGRRRKRR